MRTWGRVSSRRFILAASSLCIAIWLGILLYNWPFARKAVIAALEEESGKAVQIGDFRATFSPLGYSAENIRFSEHTGGNRTPELTIRKLVVVARPLDLFLLRKRVHRVLVSGLSATIQSQGTANQKPMPPRFLEIGEVRFNDAVVKFPTFQSDASPLTLAIKNLTFNNINQTQAGSFAAEFSTNEPEGEVHVTGQMGPLNWNDIGRAPVAGSFTVPRADLATLGGVEGLLKVSGQFTGPLNHLVCNGTADVPDFRVTQSSHAVDLSTTFRVIVNGLNGDTTLENAHSHFNRTVIESQGEISKDAQLPGKAARLRFSVEEGQVGDLLLLFTSAPQPAMAGTVDVRLNVQIPPGPPGFLKKVELNGDFGIDRGRFTQPQAQAPINHLSKSAQGLGKAAQEEDRQTVLSDVAGHVSAQHGVVTLSHISFAMPGAHGFISGTYGLLNQAVNLEGRLLTTGELSSTSSGFKAVMLKVVSPLLTKHSIKIVPFTISGTAQHPTFALNVLHKHSS